MDYLFLYLFIQFFVSVKSPVVLGYVLLSFCQGYAHVHIMYIFGEVKIVLVTLKLKLKKKNIQVHGTFGKLSVVISKPKMSLKT
jgi:hypothetical protein